MERLAIQVISQVFPDHEGDGKSQQADPRTVLGRLLEETLDGFVNGLVAAA